jgi:hypothetical protein
VKSLLTVFGLRRKLPAREIDEFSRHLFIASTEGANAVYALCHHDEAAPTQRGLGEDEWFSVFIEFHSVYLSLTDREAFRRLIPDRRTTVMNALGLHSIDSGIRALFEGAAPSKKAEIRAEFVARTNYSVGQYSQCKTLRSDDDDSPALGTLFWTFGREVAQLVQRPEDLSIIHGSGNALLEGLNTLHIEAFVYAVR